MDIYIPETIASFVVDKPYSVDKVGMSGATVLLYDDYVLKIADFDNDWRRNLVMNKWFNGVFPVPELIVGEVHDSKGYLLMSRLSGQILSSSSMLFEPKSVIKLLVGVLHRLWSLDINACPAVYTLDEKLQDCADNIVEGYFPVDSTWPRKYNGKKFDTPESLLSWLRDNKPSTDLCVTHGDLYLQNILETNGVVTGVIDFGWSGVADRYQDLALCFRSLRSPLVKIYGESVTSDLFDYMICELGISLDIGKLWYYIMLDELV